MGGTTMASFKVLGEEKKIMRRKEKEAERQAKIQERIQQVKEGPGVSSWADASDDDEQDDVFRPVSDSESDSDSDEEAEADNKDKQKTPKIKDAKGAASREEAKKDAKPKKEKKPPKDEKKA